MSTLLRDTFINTTSEIELDPSTQQRASFATVGPSGEQPLIDLLARTDPEKTQRIALPVTYGTPIEVPEPRRPVFYRGRYRATRSRLLLVAATWDGGL
ncbi:hypothetical protein OHA21_43650 [Actinoplanes sp. NBC_00393]|uniref:hypothetical protein n=1 Tax=Actinoplanes sp. NBC_00393 TaxID=2975953 RepID=UPI002E1A6A82